MYLFHNILSKNAPIKNWLLINTPIYWAIVVQYCLFRIVKTLEKTATYLQKNYMYKKENYFSTLLDIIVYCIVIIYMQYTIFK